MSSMTEPSWSRVSPYRSCCCPTSPMPITVPRCRGEEPVPGFALELRDAGVPAHIGVQRLLLGAEGVEQIQGQLPVVSFVVPLQQDLQRNSDLPGLLEHGAGHETPGEQNGGRDARLDHRQPEADGDQPSRVPDRAADLGQGKEGVSRVVSSATPSRVSTPRTAFSTSGWTSRLDRFRHRPARCGLQRPAQVAAGLVDVFGVGAAERGRSASHRTGSSNTRWLPAEAHRRGRPGPGHQSCCMRSACTSCAVPPGWPSRISGRLRMSRPPSA